MHCQTRGESISLNFPIFVGGSSCNYLLFVLFFLPFVLCLFLGIPKGMQTNRLRKRRRKNGIIEEKRELPNREKVKIGDC